MHEALGWDGRTPRRPARGAGACVLALCTLLLPACGWTADRLRDVGDVIDVKYGWAWGLGAKVELTRFLGAGLGLATFDGTSESHGREWVEADVGGFFHLLVFGMDQFGAMCATEQSINAFGIQLQFDEQPPLQGFRVGGELMLVAVHGGLYLNLGELFDFVAGCVGFDPARDDSDAPTDVLEGPSFDDALPETWDAPPASEPGI